MTTSSQQIFTIRVFNNLGVMVLETPGIDVKGTVEKLIDLRPAAAGIYTIVIWNEDLRIIRKVIVNSGRRTSQKVTAALRLLNSDRR